MKKDNVNGISLIVLAVTIVIMLILAGVAVGLIKNDDSLIDHTRNTNKKIEQQDHIMNEINNDIRNKINPIPNE